MKLEDQVISLELAKRLKELGVKQESLFYWEGNYIIPQERMMEQLVTASAFTVAELGAMLKNICYSEKDSSQTEWDVHCHFVLEHLGEQWLGSYQGEKHTVDKSEKASVHYSYMHTNEAEVRGRWLIYLLQNKLIDL